MSDEHNENHPKYRSINKSLRKSTDQIRTRSSSTIDSMLIGLSFNVPNENLDARITNLYELKSIDMPKIERRHSDFTKDCHRTP